jgi:predicted PurR-regulated permease PerM
MDDRPRTGSIPAVTIVATLLVAAVLYLAREVFIPFALALLLSFLLAPLVTVLQRLRIPKVPAVITVVSFAAVIIGAVGWLVSTQLYDVANKLPNYQVTIQKKLKAIKPSGIGVFGKTSKMLKETGEELSRAARESASETDRTDGTKPIPVEVHTPQPTSLEVMHKVLGTMLNPLAAAGIVAIFVIFMLIYMDDMRDRFLRLVGMAKLNVTTQALDDAAARVSRFILMNVVVNVTYGLPIGIGLYFIGVPNAILWGLLATLLRFIPYIGPWVAASFPVALAFAVDPGWTMFISTIVLFIVVELISNNAIEPWLYGASTGLSPIALIVAAVFWTWLWGPVGLFLSTPLTVCLAVIGRYFPQLGFFYILLADEPVLSIETRFYQRLVARDPEDAATLVKDFLKERPLVAVYDEVILPALSMAEAGRQQGTLRDEHQKHIWQNTRALVEQLADHVDVQPQHEGGDADAAGVAPPSPERPSRVSVVCIPAREHADEIAATIIVQLLERRGVGAKAFSAHALSAEFIEEMRGLPPSIICLCMVAPPAWRHAKYLCKRLRGQFPETRLCAITWGVKEEIDEIQKRIGLDPSDVVVKTIAHAVDQAGLIASNTEANGDSQAQPGHPEAVLP